MKSPKRIQDLYCFGDGNQESYFCTQNDLDMTELETRCRQLAEPVLSRMAWRIVKRMNKDLADQVQDDFARIGMSFFDQMSLKHRDTAYADFFFGFEDLLDRMIHEEIDSLDANERLMTDFRDLSISEPAARNERLFRDVKNAFGALLGEHLQTMKMQRFMERYQL